MDKGNSICIGNSISIGSLYDVVSLFPLICLWVNLWENLKYSRSCSICRVYQILDDTLFGNFPTVCLCLGHKYKAYQRKLWLEELENLFTHSMCLCAAVGYICCSSSRVKEANAKTNSFAGCCLLILESIGAARLLPFGSSSSGVILDYSPWLWMAKRKSDFILLLDCSAP